MKKEWKKTERQFKSEVIHEIIRIIDKGVD